MSTSNMQQVLQLGLQQHQAGLMAEAELLYRRVLQQDPRQKDALHLLGVIAHQQGYHDAALELIVQAIRVDEGISDYHLNLGTVYQALGRSAEALSCYERALTLDPDSASSHSNLLLALHYVPATTPERVLMESRKFARKFESPLKPFWPVHGNDRDPERRLRVGYVSPDFRNHAVARFIEPVLAHHDRRQVDVYGYYTCPIADALTDRFRNYIDHWLDCASLSDQQLFQRIREDRIDILVDLAGHTGDNRLPTFAHKPAPVQVTYLGYPATTGLAAIDYRLVTADTDPPGSEAFHSEGLYRLPRTLWCYRPPASMLEEVGQTPALDRGVITFGSMNTFSKISPETLALWGDVLRAIPESRLVMTSVPNGSARDLLLARLAAHGVTADRVTLYGRLSVEHFRSVSSEVDLVLDPYPYNGTTTTCEALWMGLPVITLIGRMSVSRSGYALLKGVGLIELCAADEAEYVRIAVALADDLPRLNDLRMGMRERFIHSPMGDEAGLARDLEQAYRDMWRAWCARPVR